MSENSLTALSQTIVDDFGANASYVEALFDRYLKNPEQVEETWALYFSELICKNGDSLPQVRNGQFNGQATNESVTAKEAAPISPTQKAKAPAIKGTPPPKGFTQEQLTPIAGGPKKIVENMELSLTVPTATSVRLVPVKLLEENRRLINRHLDEMNAGKASFTHMIAYAIVTAIKSFPQMNDGFFVVDGSPVRAKREDVNLGIAIDMQKKDGTRTLLVPNVKKANELSFTQFLHSYDDVVKRARAGKLDVADFERTTISLTNPGTIGTVGSMPRLMSGQSVIIATGAIEYPAEYQAMAPEALAVLGISKVVQISSTYDHRIIQGAESGAMLKKVQELLLGEEQFYDNMFRDLGIAQRPYKWSLDNNPTLLGSSLSTNPQRQQMTKQARVLELINAYRVRGHLIANTDPLHAVPIQYHPELDLENYGLTIWDLDREFITGGLAGVESATLRIIIDLVRRAYCGTVGAEYRHIQSKEEKVWLRNALESAPEPVPVEIRKRILWKLISAEQFEQFLHKNFLGQKRFSVEGSETVIAVLDQLIEGAATRGVEEIVLGMAHRGRLNVLANVLGNFCERIFTSFAGSVHPNFPADEGDVKYHQGAFAIREIEAKKLNLSLSPNPSHLEFVDPVVEGMARAKQEKLGVEFEESWKRVMPVLLHGDAAFAGQGIVMETLNLASLKGYRTGGTIHIIVNNQIGFTTSPEAGRSTIYSTDVAKMTQLPIFHVNADDPDAAYRVLKMALDYRLRFHKDVVLDIIGFRRLGHNEADEPSYTQPLMYQRVKAHKGVRSIYAERLIRDGVYVKGEVDSLIEERNRRYTDALERSKAIAAKQPPVTELIEPPQEADGSEIIETGISQETIETVTRQISIVPESFHLNPKMVGQLARRAKMGEGAAPADWAFGEALAWGSLVLEGSTVRLSGQDSGRGTFSQRHAVLYDTQTGKTWTPLCELAEEIRNTWKRQASLPGTLPPEPGEFHVFDSSLSEEGVLGFEYGFSVVAKEDLVMWEAQFGDFANGAQVIIDQFIAAAEDKWQQRSRLTLLLPHGYEGQGPEHSSARLERFLQLAGDNNIIVAYPTTPAQYFHLLRRQVRLREAKPLIVMTPKSLLRLAAAASPIEHFMSGGFMPVIDDIGIQDKASVTRIALSTGKVYYDLLESRTVNPNPNVALIRVEQLYPFPSKMLAEVVSSYPNAKEVVWTQEEPKNMGSWTFVKTRIPDALPNLPPPSFIGRPRSGSPSTGFYAMHQLEQKRIVEQTLGA